MPENPNPQGKGQVPILEHWESTRPAMLKAKDARTLMNDYAISLLVLSAQFRFKPVVGNVYYLYRAEGEWRLSLIAPWEWTDTRYGSYIGRCCLRTDMTWKLTPAEDLSCHRDLVADLAGFFRNFADSLTSQDTLESGLPFYVPHLPFYQRLLATGLASSIKRTAQISGLAERGAAFWLSTSASGAASTLPGGGANPRIPG